MFLHSTPPTYEDVKFVSLAVHIPHINASLLVEVDSISFFSTVDTHVVLIFWQVGDERLDYKSVQFSGTLLYLVVISRLVNKLV